jgi:beta propeller repeat protein
LATENVNVSSAESANGYRQISYNFRGEDIEITDYDFTSSDPDTEGEFVVWMGQEYGYWQIFLYNITTDTTIHLTTSGNNVNPAISDNYIVWEGQVDGVWQIFVFDGVKTTQLTSGDLPSQNIDIEGKYVVYSQMETAGGGWKVYTHNLENGRTITLTPDGYGSFPSISGGVVEWTALVGETPVQYFYEIATDTVTASEPDTPAIPVDEVFDEAAFQEFIEVTETTEPDQPEQVTIQDIQEELGITPSVPEVSESTESSEAVQVTVE